MDAYWRAANYLSVGQIYLYDNPLLKRPLMLADVKHLLLGHWGTTPGQNFIYVHLNRIIKKYDLDMIYISGPGHGGPAVVANIEGLDRREDCERVVETARRGGRDDVGCVVLGRGADEKKVVSWLETAPSVPGFIGFAVGRRTFWEAVAAYEAHTSTRREASARVAQRFREWPTIFERARSVISRN
jgi:hypothetical protein